MAIIKGIVFWVAYIFVCITLVLGDIVKVIAHMWTDACMWTARALIVWHCSPSYITLFNRLIDLAAERARGSEPSITKFKIES